MTRFPALHPALSLFSVEDANMKIEKMAMELLGLSATQRALLAKQLIASLDETERQDVEALWVREAEARYLEIETGKVKCRPVDEALRDARKKLK